MTPETGLGLSEAPISQTAGADKRADGRRALAPGIAACARFVLLGIVLYAAIDTALVFLRPQFSILHSAESDYGSLGSWDWLMDLNFLLRGLLSLAAVRAITLAARDRDASPRLRHGLRLLSIWALASALLAFFPDDPAGTPVHWHGVVHLVLAFAAFICVLVGALVVSHALRSLPGWAPVAMPLTVLAWGALIPLLLLGHSHLRRATLGGLWEKIFLAIELVWLLVAALAAARYRDETPWSGLRLGWRKDKR
jgi:Protein of unknown function (DUF998)